MTTADQDRRAAEEIARGNLFPDEMASAIFALVQKAREEERERRRS